MNSLPIYILAGGESSRFGSDKARAVVGDEPMIVRLAQQIEPSASRITVVAKRDEQYDDLKLRTIGDTLAQRGPIGGLVTALQDLRQGEDWLLLLSCDLLNIELTWIDVLWSQRGDAQVVAFRPDCWQPMLGLYHRSVLAEAQHRANGDDRSMQRLLDALDAVAPPLPADWPQILQVNRPTDMPGEGHQPR
jgi:molybdopterin-guanine dinucleotide biosynthesis protein A